jgi:6-phospho-3-hexuloisomerase
MSHLYRNALDELAGVFERLDDSAVDAAVERIATVRRIVVFGGGREKLQIMGFAMRLFHMGLAVAVEGDMTTPPVGPGDLAGNYGGLAASATSPMPVPLAEFGPFGCQQHVLPVRRNREHTRL